MSARARSGHRVTHSITSSASCWRSNGTSRSNATPPHKRRLACLETVARAGAPPAPSVWPLQYREAVGIVAHTGDSRDHHPAPEIDHPHSPARRSAGIKARPLLVDLVRGRFEYPELVTAASALYRKWKVDWATTNLVIEDKGSGSSLIQSLKNEARTTA